MFAAKENNITRLLDLTQLQHPTIAAFKHILVDRNMITFVQEHVDAPKLIPFICSQKQYITENIIAQIAH